MTHQTDALTQTQQTALETAAREWLAGEPEGTTPEILDGGMYDDLIRETIGLPEGSSIPTDAWHIVRRVYADLRRWELIEGGDGFAYATIEADSVEDALEIARGNVDRDQYDPADEQSTLYIDVCARNIVTGEMARATVVLEPEAPECLAGQEHDWQSPHELVAGIKENPGVWGHGGGVIIHEACLRCGCRRTTDTWAQRPDTGQQGLTEVRYEADYYDLDELGYVVEEREIPTVTADQLTICRSDLGDGGWSLHRGDEDDVLASGEAEQTDDGWSRPNADDYRAAIDASRESRWIVLDRSDSTYTVARDEDDAREIAYRCRLGHVGAYVWQDAE